MKQVPMQQLSTVPHVDMTVRVIVYIQIKHSKRGKITVKWWK